MDKFVIWCTAIGVAALVGIVVAQHSIISELEDKYQAERTFSDMAMAQSAACYNSKRRYISFGGRDLPF